MTWPSVNQQEKITYHLEDFTDPVDPRMKIKENLKIDKYLDLVRELKKLWNMKMTAIIIADEALGTVSKSLEKRLVNGRLEDE